eukprot:TRINITY_DN27574_c0_g1_i1.p1 TRINITY_DN27574_c0_g1~~TRINITY_DN27574_c0_g1_i1.p1  ORF type:complete len:600 (-),score=116.41 TRINITY_DN27574_c0_g1_i1:59-1858(-)
MSIGNSNEASVDYDPITGRSRRHNGGTARMDSTSRMDATGRMDSTSRMDSTCRREARPTGHQSQSVTGGASSGKKVGFDANSVLQSVAYDPLADGTGHNIDTDGYTYMGTEIHERFSSMRDAFLKCDTNRDGRVTKRELSEMCRNWNIPMSEAQRVISAADEDASGTLDFNEFCRRFDPFYGRDMREFSEPLSASVGGIQDDRPIKSCSWGAGDAGVNDTPGGCGGCGGGGCGGSFGGDDSGRHSGGNDRSMRSTSGGGAAMGSGSRAVRALAQNNSRDNMEVCATCGKLRETIAELESNVNYYKTKSDKLEAMLAEMEARQAAFEGGGGGGNGGGRGSRGYDDGYDDRERTTRREHSRGGDSRGGGSRADDREVRFEDERIDPESERRAREQAEQDAKRAQEQAEHDAKTVLVFGQKGDGKTDAMCKALYNAKIPYELRDIESCKVRGRPPIVVFGDKVWIDDGSMKQDEDSMCAVPFPQLVCMEIRRMTGLGVDHTPVPVRDADIETELAERFSSMQEAFLKCDTDRDGKVTRRELIEKCKLWNIRTTEAERALDGADINMDGGITFDEFAKHFDNMFPRRIKGGHARAGHAHGRRH